MIHTTVTHTGYVGTITVKSSFDSDFDPAVVLNTTGDISILITADEWPLLRDTIEEVFTAVSRQKLDTRQPIPHAAECRPKSQEK